MRLLVALIGLGIRAVGLPIILGIRVIGLPIRLGIRAVGLPIILGIRAVGLPIRLGIRAFGLPISLVRGSASALGHRLKWLRPVAHIGLNFLVVLRSNSIASTAITLSIINFGLIVWQIWPEDTERTITGLSQPTRNAETLGFDNTPGRITELENQIRELSREQRFQFDRLRDCINYPSPFGCP